MPSDMIELIRMCGACKAELEAFEVKKENMMLLTKVAIWCPYCQAERTEIRDIAGRHEAVQKEKTTLPKRERT